MESCLKHGRRFRCRLEFVLNQLRSTGKLTHSQAARMFGILCTCQNMERSAQECDFSNSEFSKAYNQVQTLLDAGRDQDGEGFFPSHSAKVLIELFKSLANANQQGLTRLVVMLAKIVTSEFDITYFTNSKNEKLIAVLSLNLPVCYTGRFVGRHGHGLLEIREKTDCNINLKGGKRISDAHPLMIRIEGSSMEKLDLASSLLRERAKNVTDEKKIHERRVREYRKRRNKKRMASLLAREKSKHHQQVEAKGVLENVKNLNRTEYDRQKIQQHKIHNSRTKVKGHRVLAEGSRCLNCLGTFDAEEIKQGACTYHPGFIVDEDWSCCGKSSIDQHPSHNDHKMTGCSKSVHNYRPTQKRHGKSSLNSAKESKSSLLRDGTELLQDFKLKM